MAIRNRKFNIINFPREIPIFALSGVVLLPRGHLPLNIFEPRYINLVDDALKGDRMVGIVQTSKTDDKGGALFTSGCLGKISTFSEGEDGRYLVILTGLSRFNIQEELKPKNNYRRVSVCYEPFSFDVLEEEDIYMERQKLLSLLKEYLNMHDIVANWDEINAAPDEKLITSLAMICPFEPREKQALLETSTLLDRCRMMTALIEMAFLKDSTQPWVSH